MQEQFIDWEVIVFQTTLGRRWLNFLVTQR